MPWKRWCVCNKSVYGNAFVVSDNEVLFLVHFEIFCCLLWSSVKNHRPILYKCIPTCWVELMSKMWILISIFISIVVYLSVPSFKSFWTNKCFFIKLQMITVLLGPLHIILIWCVWSWCCNLRGTSSIVNLHEWQFCSLGANFRLTSILAIILPAFLCLWHCGLFDQKVWWVTFAMLLFLYLGKEMRTRSFFHILVFWVMASCGLVTDVPLKAWWPCTRLHSTVNNKMNLRWC